MAIALHFEDSGTTAAPAPQAVASVASSSSRPPQPNSSLMDELNSVSNEGVVYPPAATGTVNYSVQEGSALSMIQIILFYPFTLGYKLFNTLFYFLASIFPFLPRLTGYYPANRTATRSVHKIDAKTTASRIIRAFEENYGNGGPSFFEGGFTEAFDLAKSKFNFLVVIVQSDEHDLTGPFNRQVLTDPRVVELLNREDVIVWFGNVQNSEGLQVADSLGCTQFPFAQLIAPFTRSPTSFALVMKTLATIQGETDPMEFISRLEEKMEAHGPTIMSLVLDRQERERDRNLRDEQNAAYERSLAADRERERLAREEAARLEREEQEREEAAARSQELEEDRLRNLEAWKAWRVSKLGPEFESTTERPARISVRLPSGERIVRKFSPDQTIEDIYAFVECYDYIKTCGSAVPTEVSPPEGYVHKYSFELASTLPRKVLVADSTRIGDDKTVWPSASLIVEIDDEEENDLDD